MTESSKVYMVETPKEIFWSKMKMDRDYKHIEYLYRDKARAKEMTEERFKKYRNNTSKQFWEIIA